MMKKQELQSRELSWQDLKPFLSKGNLIVVHFAANFDEITNHIIADNEEYIRHYMNALKISRPNEKQIQKWDLTPDKKFRIIQINQFILFQEILKRHY